MRCGNSPSDSKGPNTPILVIDLDVHQGNGTAKIFEDDPRVITFSAHGTYPILMGFVYAQSD
jgi:acetoin utilization deacetylase AcuC-like enzyme